MILHRTEKELLGALEKIGKGEIGELGLNPDSARRAAFWLQEKGLAKVEERESSGFLRTEECDGYLKTGFPEVNLLSKEGVPLSQLDAEGKIGLQWAKRNGWIEIVDGKIKKIGDAGEYSLAKAAAEPERASKSDLEILLKRRLLREEKGKETIVSLTEEGKKEAKGIGEIKEEIGELTSQIITGGAWRNAEFRPYAIAPTKDAPVGKAHPMTKMAQKVRRVFEDLGFEEMEGNVVESAFWNFDALFQPQDHPAREMADTFYLEGEEPLPGEELVERVKKAHEKGWKCKWSAEEAKRRVLRTHTTALSARYLEGLKKGEGRKYFAIGRVFRNEATDFKHLAEFHQVEGIVAWDRATFRDLLGLIKEFYSRFGFDKVRFRPSYFPYTEPSVEVEVFYGERNEWMEIGGAGIFRPEMTKAICDVYPVLAWGLSLERPLMLMEGLKDIRTFYKNDLDWLRGAKLKE